MLRQLAGWVYGLTSVLILGGILLQVAPKGVYQKLLHVFLGLILLLALCSPVLNLLGITDRMAQSYEEFLPSWPQSEIAAGSEASWQQVSAQRREDSMEEPLRLLAAEYGYELLAVRMDWNEAGSEIVGVTLEIRAGDSQAVGDRSGTVPSGSDGGIGIAGVEAVEPVRASGVEADDAPAGGVQTEELQEVLADLFSLPASQVRLQMR